MKYKKIGMYALRNKRSCGNTCSTYCFSKQVKGQTLLAFTLCVIDLSPSTQIYKTENIILIEVKKGFVAVINRNNLYFGFISLTFISQP